MKNADKPEVLAPAGSTESIYAAVRCGADGIYIGGKSFSARANAVNFSYEEMKAAAEYCHLHGVKLYRAMNVIIFDSEAEEFCNEVIRSAQAGIDGLIIQDMGGAYLAAKAVRDMPRHASTQMTIHTPMGAVAAADNGFCRIVPARELSLKAIEEICGTGVETEVFVHGAQCMCVSGQCYMSAMIGSRSANRGQCAQACRLPFAAVPEKGKESYALSLKDMSLVGHTQELIRAGAASFKIEGRMKRPEYVAAAVTAMRKAVDGKSEPQDMDMLEAVFSRSGFTDGYLEGRLDSSLFGYRRKEDVVAANDVLSSLAALYRNERKSGEIAFHFTAHANAPCILEFSADGVSGRIMGMIPEKARNRSLAAEDVSKQLSKLGDTRYVLKSIECDLEEGIMLPASELNRIRREAAAMADKLTIEKNTPRYDISTEPFRADIRGAVYDGMPAIRLRSDSWENITAYLAQKAELIILPVHKCEELDSADYMDKLAAELPAFVTDEKKLAQRLDRLYEKGIRHFICQCFTHLGILGKMQGIYIHGGMGLNIANSYAAEQMQKNGASDIILSPEMKAAQIRSVKSSIPTGIIAYGRLPLMTVRNCPVRAQTGCGKCTGGLTDRTGRFFPVKCSPEGYSVIYNSDVLETSDKLGDFSGIGFIQLDISGLEGAAAEKIVDRYRRGAKPSGSFTRGLYYRGVL